MLNLFNLTGKRILVTGASSGIGRSVAIVLAKFGANVVCVGRNENRLHEVVKSLEGADHSEFIVDFTNQDSVEKFIQVCPKIDGLVHSAGVIDIVPFKLTDKRKLLALLEINCSIPIEITSKLLRKRVLNMGSSIVFVSSINGLNIGAPGFTSYAASKSALVGLTKSLSLELAPKIRVNCVAPGMINTPMTDQIDKLVGKEKLDEDQMGYPMKTYGSPEDVAYGVLYLVSQASRWVTGTTLVIDGGRSVK